MQTIIRGAAADGAGDVEEIAIAIGAGAQYRIAEDDGVGQH